MARAPTGTGDGARVGLAVALGFACGVPVGCGVRVGLGVTVGWGVGVAGGGVRVGVAPCAPNTRMASEPVPITGLPAASKPTTPEFTIW